MRPHRIELSTRGMEMASETLVTADRHTDPGDGTYEKWRNLPTSSGYGQHRFLVWLFGEPERGEGGFDPVDLKRTFRLHTRGFITLGAIPLAVFSVTAAVEDTMGALGEFGDSRIGLYEDVVVLSMLVVIPLAVVLLERLLRIAGKTFDNLQKSINKRQITKEAYAHVLSRIWEIIDAADVSVSRRKPRSDEEDEEKSPVTYRRVLRWLMAGGFVFWVYSSFAHATYLGYEAGTDIWSFGNHPLSFVARSLWELGLFAVIYPLLLYKVLALIYSMNVFFTAIRPEGFRVRAVAPDGAAGLGDMGRLALNIELLFVPFIILAVIYALITEGITAISVVTIPLLMILLVAAFFFPLASAHQTMKQAKESVLDALEREFNAYYDFLIRLAEDPGRPLSDEKAARSVSGIKEVKYLYEETEKMPVWPFDLTTIRRFTASILLPTIVVILGEWGPTLLGP